MFDICFLYLLRVKFLELVAMSSLFENYRINVNSDSDHVLYKYMDSLVTNLQRMIHNFA